jgi:hypothetical protein
VISRSPHSFNFNFPFLLHHAITMPPFRNLLGRKPQPNGAPADGFDENHLSPHPRPGPLPIRRSCDDEPNEYQLSGESTVELDSQTMNHETKY